MIAFDRPWIIGHRGNPRGAMENTLPSFMAALDAGARGVELDVRLSRDGRLFVYHDGDFRRLLGIPGSIESRTSDEIRGLVFPGTALRIPELEDVLVALSDRDAVALVELKTPSVLSGDLLRTVVATVERTRTHDRVAFLSFCHAGMLTLRQMLPGVSAAPIFEFAPGIDTALFVAKDWIVLEAKAVTPRWMDAMTRSGVRVACYGVDTAECDARLDTLGVGLRISDDVGALVLRRRASAGAAA
jgi:glycerophosphoryl diester phosphodiesterase